MRKFPHVTLGLGLVLMPDQRSFSYAVSVGLLTSDARFPKTPSPDTQANVIHQFANVSASIAPIVSKLTLSLLHTSGVVMMTKVGTFFCVIAIGTVKKNFLLFMARLMTHHTIVFRKPTSINVKPSVALRVKESHSKI